MDRRGFIGKGTASAIGIVGASACMPRPRLAAQQQSTMPADMDEYLARVDAGAARMGQWSTASVVPEWTGDRDEADALARTTLQTLFITAMIADLPAEAQLRPDVQQRLHAAVPLMNEATERVTNFLGSVSEADLARVQIGLRDYAAGDAIFAGFDREGAASGLSEWRRAQTREIFAQTEWRLRNQPPALIVDEYLTKVNKLADADISSEVRMQALAARAGEEAFWKHTSEKSLHDARISRGLKTMGYGLLIFAGGGAIVALGAFPGVFVMTVGAVMLIVGLIILLVGAVTPNRPR